MRIKKVSQTTPVQAHLTNAYSESTQDGYSADYINNNVGIVESGSNGNGNYIKFADGTLIQYAQKNLYDQAINNKYGNSPIYYGSRLIDFPIEFLNDKYAVSVGGFRNTTAMNWASGFPQTKSVFLAVGFDYFPREAGEKVVINWQAIGKWK